MESKEQVEKELEELARKLGGGWRIDMGIMPMITLTVNEARKLAERLATPSTSGYHHDAGGATDTLPGEPRATPVAVADVTTATKFPPRPADCNCPIGLRSVGTHSIGCPCHPDYRPAA